MPEPTDGYRPIPIALPPTGVFVFESYHRPGFHMAVQQHENMYGVLEIDIQKRIRSMPRMGAPGAPRPGGAFGQP